MALNIHLQFPDDSPEAKMIYLLAQQSNISPEAAAAQLIAEGAIHHRSPVNAENITAVRPSEEEAAILDEVVREAYENRLVYQTRDLDH